MPKVEYEYIKKHMDEPQFKGMIFSAIANSTPLPKGHGDLIDKNELTVDYTSYDWDDYVSAEQIKNAEVVVEADNGDEDK